MILFEVKMANVCIQMCSSMQQIPMRILCTVLVLLQGFVLDYYLVTYKNKYWYSWIVADVALFFTFFMAFVISYRHLLLANNSKEQKIRIQTGPLPLGYFAWLVYSSLLAARVAIIFKDIAYKLNEEDFFGPNTLKIAISSAAFVFLFLLLTHHNAETDSLRKILINELTGTVVFDVLDSVDVLDVLFNHKAIEDFPVHLDTAIIAVACINFILPTLPLATLSSTHFGHKKAPREIIFLHKMLLVFLVNLPLLIIRLLLWHVLSKEISVFPVKNLIVIFLVFYDMFEKRKEEIEREADGTDEMDEAGIDLCHSRHHRTNSGSFSQDSYRHHSRHPSGSLSHDGSHRHRHDSVSSNDHQKHHQNPSGLSHDHHHHHRHRHMSGSPLPSPVPSEQDEQAHYFNRAQLTRDDRRLWVPQRPHSPGHQRTQSCSSSQPGSLEE